MRITPHIHHIIDDKFYSLYIGNHNSTEQLNTLKSKNFRTVICVDKPLTTHFTNIQYYQVHLNNDDLLQTFVNVANIITEALKLSSVLIACQNGVTNAPTVVIAYLISKGWPYEKAFYYVKEKRNVINPSLHCKQQLQKYYESVTQKQQQEELFRFTQAVKNLQSTLYYEESPCFNNNTDSFQDDGTKTPGFQSPIMKFSMRSRKNSFKNSHFRSTSCNQEKKEYQNNYSFHLDEINEQANECPANESPKFIQVIEISDDEQQEMIRLRHRRHRRGLNRNKSAHQQ